MGLDNLLLPWSHPSSDYTLDVRVCIGRIEVIDDSSNMSLISIKKGVAALNGGVFSPTP